MMRSENNKCTEVHHPPPQANQQRKKVRDRGIFRGVPSLAHELAGLSLLVKHFVADFLVESIPSLVVSSLCEWSVG
jgi:hypothetical protein